MGAAWAGNEQLAMWAWSMPAVIVALSLCVAHHPRPADQGRMAVDNSSPSSPSQGRWCSASRWQLRSSRSCSRPVRHSRTYAEGQAKRELTALLGSAPKKVTRYAAGAETGDRADGRGRGGRSAAGRPRRGGAGGWDGREGRPRCWMSRRSRARVAWSRKEEGDMVASGVVNGGSSLRHACDGHGESQHVCRYRAPGTGRRIRPKHPSCAWPTATGLLFVPLTLGHGRASRGWSRATRCEHWRYWSWRRPVRSCCW